MALDVYALTRHRDMVTVNRFLDEFVDRAASEDREDEELLIEPLGVRPDGVTVDWESEPSLTLSHIIERGLAYPRRAFNTYLTSRHPEIERAILGFTRDDQLVLGLSVPIGDIDDDEARAKALLHRLADTYQCHIGLILVETRPPSSEAEFQEANETWSVVYFVRFDG